MKNLTISKKLFLTFGLIAVLFCFTVIIAIISLFSTGNKFESFYKGPYEITNKSADAETNIQTVAKLIGYSMMEEDENKTAQYIQTAKDTIEKLRDATSYMRENFKEGISIVDTYDSTMKSVMDDRDKVFELAGQNRNSEAIELYFSKVMPEFIKAQQNLVEIGTMASEIATNNYNKAMGQIRVTTVTLLSLFAITLAITILMALYIIKSITYPIKELEKAAKEMSEGSLNISIDYESKDELGNLANSIRVLTEGVKTIIEDIGRILDGLSKGDFHVTSNCLENYKLDYVPILTAMRLIRDNLNGTLSQISESAQQVAIGSSQMAESAQSLAEGATDQAGAVEELTATIENVAAMAEGIASNAENAFERIQKSGEKAENGSKEMEKLTEAMGRISNTSKEIENIITSIEDIASQTNMLSLNASIEAARAGEAGKGFAVVANQIGKLAADSSQSALNTRELIVKTLDEIEIGNSITVSTSEAFKDVIDSMRDFAEVARDSSEASTSQASSLKQVQQGIEQISSVVQNNSAAAEETSATSEELLAQSENLKSLVSRFKLLN